MQSKDCINQTIYKVFLFSMFENHKQWFDSGNILTVR